MYIPCYGLDVGADELFSCPPGGGQHVLYTTSITCIVCVFGHTQSSGNVSRRIVRLSKKQVRRFVPRSVSFAFTVEPISQQQALGSSGLWRKNETSIMYNSYAANNQKAVFTSGNFWEPKCIRGTTDY